MVTPRTRRKPVLRNVTDMWRSSTMAPPRVVTLDSPRLVETSATGASPGRSTFTEVAGSSAVSCATRGSANAATARNGSLFENDIGDGHPLRIHGNMMLRRYRHGKGHCGLRLL